MRYPVLALSALVVLTGTLAAVGLAAQASGPGTGAWSAQPVDDSLQPGPAGGARATGPSPTATDPVPAHSAAPSSPSAAPKPAVPKPTPKPSPKPKAKSTPVVPAPSDGSVSEKLRFYINSQRAAKGLTALKPSAPLTTAATLHSRCMSAEHRLSHRCAGESDLGARFQAQGIDWRGAAENVGQSHASATNASMYNAAKGLTDSMFAEGPGGGHYENLYGDSTFIGIGIVRDADGTLWLTQDFYR